MDLNYEHLVLDLYQCGAIRFGTFTLHDGMETPIYLDMRLLYSYPNLLENFSFCLWSDKSPSLHCDIICGVPYAALPFTSVISNFTKIPMILQRKHEKKYGTKKSVEGVIIKGKNCVIIEDTVVGGEGILETTHILRDAGLIVTDALVLVDRQQGATNNLQRFGVKLHSLLNLNNILHILHKNGIISLHLKILIEDFIVHNQVEILHSKSKVEKTQNENQNHISENLNYEMKKNLCCTMIGQQLIQIMLDKKTNLCISVNTREFCNLLHIADCIGAYICLLKIHADILKDFSFEYITALQKLSVVHNFLILEDRKFSETKEITNEQYSGGTLHINKWAHTVTAYALTDTILGLKSAVKNRTETRGVFLVNKCDNECSPLNINRKLQLIKEHADFIVGYISQNKIFNNPTILHVMSEIQDKSSAKYVNPEEAILNRGADIFIINITNSNNLVDTVTSYQKRCYNAYLKRTEHHK